MDIREAVFEDLDRLREMEQGIVSYERPFASNLREDPIQYYDLGDLITRDDAQVLVAISEGTIIGSGYGLIKNSKPYFQPDRFVYLGFMYVSPEYRGQGVNGKIIDGLIEWAKQKGIHELQLEVYAENESAIKAYQKRNFSPDLLNMRLHLND